METNHELLGKLLLEFEDAVWWLTDERWIVLGYDGGGFPQYFEHRYFKPGTQERRVEVLVAPVVVNGVQGLAGFYRTSDTVENREAFRAALAEFHEKRSLSLAEVDVVGKLREDITNMFFQS